MNNYRLLNNILGVIIVLFSISYIHILFPLPSSENNPAVQGIVKMYEDIPQNIRKWSDKERGTNYAENFENLREDVIRDLKIVWIKTLLFIFWGVITGLLILKKNILGRYNAIFWAALLLFLKMWGYGKYLPDLEKTLGRIKLFYSFMFKDHPLQLFQGEIIPLILYSVSLAYLLRPSVAESFTNQGNVTC